MSNSSQTLLPSSVLSCPLLSYPFFTFPFLPSLLFSQKLPFPSINHMVSGDRCKLRQTVYPLKISCTSRGIQYRSLLSALFPSTWIELSMSYCVRAWRRTKSDWALCRPQLLNWTYINIFRLGLATLTKNGNVLQLTNLLRLRGRHTHTMKEDKWI